MFMNLKKYLASAILIAVLLSGSALARAQEPVTGARDPESLFSSTDPGLHANKQVVLHIVRDLLEANRWSDAPKYLTKRYLQHNPNVASGLEPVMIFFGNRAPGLIPKRGEWKTKVVSVVAEGDLVVVATVRQLPRPGDPTKTYTTTWFDMWRIKEGKADEHWDGATLPAPPPAKKQRAGIVRPRTNSAICLSD
jgi:predicted SnoaL-like aldol condensation-catalyzing enzyme